MRDALEYLFFASPVPPVFYAYRNIRIADARQSELVEKQDDWWGPAYSVRSACIGSIVAA